MKVRICTVRGIRGIPIYVAAKSKILMNLFWIKVKGGKRKENPFSNDVLVCRLSRDSETRSHVALRAGITFVITRVHIIEGFYLPIRHGRIVKCLLCPCDRGSTGDIYKTVILTSE